MHLLLKTEDFVQNRLLILHFWLRKKVYFEENPPLLVVSWHSSAAFLPNFWLFPSPTVQHCCKNTSQLVFLMPPTSPASFVQIGALWIFFLPRVPPYDNFRILIKCKKVAFFVFRDTDPIFWLDTQDCPRNNSKSLPPGVTPCFAEKSALWCTGFCVLASSSQAPGVKKVSFPKLFPF